MSERESKLHDDDVDPDVGAGEPTDEFPPDDASADPRPPKRTTGRWWLSLLLTLAIAGGAAWLCWVIFSTEPTAEKGGATKRTAMLVEVVGVERGTFHPRILAMGTVEPARDVQLNAQVQGRVVSMAPSFEPGGFVAAGTALVQLERADFEFVLAQRRSELRQAESDLVLEKGRGELAAAEVEYVGGALSPGDAALVLREPQLEAAQQRVAAARAAVEQARLDVRRTRIEAPFDAHILTRQVDVGSQVAPGDPLARIVGTDSYWVRIELPLSKLRWIAFPDTTLEGVTASEVVVRNRQAWDEAQARYGYVLRLIGTLDPTTRMAHVLAEIPDPLARRPEHRGLPPLLIDEFLEVTIRGTPLVDVVRLPRELVRAEDTVWLMEDGKLRIVELDIALLDAEYAYVRAGLDASAQVVTTNLSTVVDGSPLRLEGDE